MKRLSILFSSLILLSIAGCQTVPSQPKLSTVSEAETKVPDGMGQLIVYRTNLYGIMKAPTIAVDGNVKGGCEFRSALFVNLEPGRHRVSLDTANFEVEIKANQKTYASCIPWMLEVVDAETGAAKVEGLSYQGTY